MTQVRGREGVPDPVPTAATDGIVSVTPDERAELDRLRAENQELRAGAHPPRRRIRWRSVIAVVLLVFGCVGVPVSLLAVWTHNQVADTDRFVDTTAPLITDPAVQQVITDRVTATVSRGVPRQAVGRISGSGRLGTRGSASPGGH
jgi:hypothetical protein